MTAAEEAQAKFHQVALTSTVRVRRGQVPVGKGELAVHGGILVLTLRGTERIRAPVAGVQRRLSPLFADEAIRSGRRWLPRQRYRLTFVDLASGEKDKDAASRWGRLLYEFDSERKRATALDRVAGTAQAAASGVLRDRVWRRTRALGKEHGTLQLAHGQLDFTSSQGETLRLAVSEITKIGAAPWRSGRMTIKAGDQRHVFGFDPRRLGDGTWEEGEIRKLEGDRAGGAGIADAGLDPSGGVSSSQGVVDAYEFASGLELIGVMLVGALEGSYTRRIRRRDWRRVLRNERSAGELLTARAEKARAKLEQDDLLTGSFERSPPVG